MTAERLRQFGSRSDHLSSNFFANLFSSFLATWGGIKPR
jgi:hypothetical protein